MNTTCPACGAENLGTRFCESCGAPAPAASTGFAPVAANALAANALPTGARATPDAGSAWRVAFLITFLVAHLVPPIVEAAALLAGSWDPNPARWTTVALLVVAGLVGVVAAASGPARAGAGRAVGAVFVLGATALEIWYSFAGMGWQETLQIVVIVTVYVAWYLGWTLAAGLAPRAYAGLAVLAVAIALQVAVPALLLLAGVWDAMTLVVSTVVATLVLVLAVVGITRAIHRSVPAAVPSAFTAAAAAIGPEATPVPALATTALWLAVGALIVIPLTVLLGFAPGLGFIGLVVSVLYLGLIAGAIVTGHLARRPIAAAGGAGRGRALAGMIIGYALAGLVVAGITVQFVTWQIVLASINASSNSYDETYDDIDDGLGGEFDDDEAPDPVTTPTVPAGPRCEDLFSSSVVSAANSAGLVLNPSWSIGTSPGGLELADAELSGFLASTTPLDCRWLTPGGGSGYGIRTTVVKLDASDAAWVEYRLSELGYLSQPESAGTRYFFEASAAGSAYGESHMVVDGVWFATHWLEYGPRGYTVDVVTNYFS